MLIYFHLIIILFGFFHFFRSYNISLFFYLVWSVYHLSIKTFFNRCVSCKIRSVGRRHHCYILCMKNYASWLNINIFMVKRTRVYILIFHLRTFFFNQSISMIFFRIILIWSCVRFYIYNYFLFITWLNFFLTFYRWLC